MRCVKCLWCLWNRKKFNVWRHHLLWFGNCRKIFTRNEYDISRYDFLRIFTFAETNFHRRQYSRGILKSMAIALGPSLEWVGNAACPLPRTHYVEECWFNISARPRSRGGRLWRGALAHDGMSVACIMNENLTNVIWRQSEFNSNDYWFTRPKWTFIRN